MKDQQQEQTVDRLKLARLITAHRARTGQSYRDMARRAGISTTTLQNLGTTELRRMPDRESLEGVAKALDLKLAVVTRLAGEACGYVLSTEALPDDPESVAILTAMGDLQPGQRRKIMDFVQMLREANRQ